MKSPRLYNMLIKKIRAIWCHQPLKNTCKGNQKKGNKAMTFMEEPWFFYFFLVRELCNSLLTPSCLLMPKFCSPFPERSKFSTSPSPEKSAVQAIRPPYTFSDSRVSLITNLFFQKYWSIAGTQWAIKETGVKSVLLAWRALKAFSGFF